MSDNDPNFFERQLQNVMHPFTPTDQSPWERILVGATSGPGGALGGAIGALISNYRANQNANTINDNLLSDINSGNADRQVAIMGNTPISDRLGGGTVADTLFASDPYATGDTAPSGSPTANYSNHSAGNGNIGITGIHNSPSSGWNNSMAGWQQVPTSGSYSNLDAALGLTDWGGSSGNMTTWGSGENSGGSSHGTGAFDNYGGSGGGGGASNSVINFLSRLNMT